MPDDAIDFQDSEEFKTLLSDTGKVDDSFKKIEQRLNERQQKINAIQQTAVSDIYRFRK